MIPGMNPRVSHMLDKLPTTIPLPCQCVPFLNTAPSLQHQYVPFLIEETKGSACCSLGLRHSGTKQQRVLYTHLICLSQTQQVWWDTHICILILGELRQEDRLKFKASLGYIASYRPFWVTERDLDSKAEKERRKERRKRRRKTWAWWHKSIILATLKTEAGRRISSSKST